jgi:hypothetical protein
MIKKDIIVITQDTKNYLLKMCDKELKNRDHREYIDVDVEYLENETNNKPLASENWLLGFITSAIVFATLSYSFALAKVVYYFILFL